MDDDTDDDRVDDDGGGGGCCCWKCDPNVVFSLSGLEVPENKEKLLLLLEYFWFFSPLLSARITSGTGCFRNMAGSRGKALGKPCRVRLVALLNVQCVWLVNTQYSVILYTPPPPYRVFLFVAHFFLLSSFLVTRFVFVFEEPFFDGGVKHNSLSNSFPGAVWWCSLDCEVQHTYRSQQRHRRTYRQFTFTHMCLFLKWQLWQFCSCCYGSVWCCNSVGEGKRDTLH